MNKGKVKQLQCQVCGLWYDMKGNFIRYHNEDCGDFYFPKSIHNLCACGDVYTPFITMRYVNPEE